MPPRNVDVPPIENEVTDALDPVVIPNDVISKHVPLKIVWRNVILMGAIHCMAVYGLFLLPWIKPATWLFSGFLLFHYLNLMMMIFIMACIAINTFNCPDTLEQFMQR